MKLLEFIFQSFYHFLGITILLSGMANFLISLYSRLIRHLNIRKHGWPPQWCDADGDLTESESEMNNEK